MKQPGDMWRVEYPDDTGPTHAPLDWPPRTEAPTMVEDKDFVYVDRYGNTVSADDAAAQTKFHADELKALRKGGYFPKAPGAAAEEAKADDAPSPVMHSGVGAQDDGDAEPPAKAPAKK
jgi:hypothetical protein